MNSAELARKIRILEIKIDIATKDRSVSAAAKTAMLNELGALYQAAR